MSLQCKAPTRDIQFVLDEVLNADRHYQKVGFPDMSVDFRNSVLEEMAKFSEEVSSPVITYSKYPRPVMCHVLACCERCQLLQPCIPLRLQSCITLYPVLP